MVSKYNYCMKVIFVLISVLATFDCFADKLCDLHQYAELNVGSPIESYSRAAGQKFYSGKYRLSGFGIDGTQTLLYGTAEYYYNENPDGSRAFEGPFKFEQSVRGNSGTASGCFKNDRQIGHWEWTQMLDTDEPMRSYINFNENGVPDGEFYISGWGEHYEGRVSNGYPTYVEYYSNDGYKGVKYIGRFNSNGMPIGKWVYSESGKYSLNRTINMSFNDDGKLIKSGYRDDSTGDWVSVSGPYTKDIFFWVRDAIMNKCYRSSATEIKINGDRAVRVYGGK